MTKVITYNNIQLSFQADTSGIKASKAELAALTREVNSQKTPLDKFMRQLEVINQQSAKMAPKDVDARLRAVTRRFIDAEAAAGNYNKALYTVGQLVPQLADETARLAMQTRSAEMAQNEFAATEQRRATRLAAEEQERAARIARNMAGGIAIIPVTQARQELAVRQQITSVTQEQNNQLDLQETNLRSIANLEQQLLTLRQQQLSPEQRRAQALNEFINSENQRLALRRQELQRQAVFSMTPVSASQQRALFDEANANIRNFANLQREVEAEQENINAAMREQNRITNANARLQSLVIQPQQHQRILRQEALAAERRHNAELERRRNLIRDANRDLMAGAAMAGMPGGMLFGMSRSAIGGFAAAGAIVASLKAYSDLRNQLVRLEVQFGSTAIAAQKFAEIRLLAAQSPLQTSDLMSAATVLAQYGINAKELIPILSKLSEISMGDASRMEGLARAFAQVKAAGRLMGQEVLQFTNSGFNPLNAMAQHLAKTFGGLAQDHMPWLKKQMEEGKIAAQDVADTLTMVTSKGGQFFEQNKKQAEELTAKYNALIDSIKKLGEAFGEMLAPMAKPAMSKATFIFENYAASFKAIGETLKMIGGSKDRKTWTEIVRNLEDELIAIEQKNLGINFDGIAKENGRLFQNLEDLKRKQSGTEAKELQEKQDKALAKIKERVEALKEAKKLEDEIAKISMTDMQRKQADAKSRLEEVKKEILERAKAEIDADMARRNSTVASQRAIAEATKRANDDIAKAKLQSEKLAYMDQFEKIRDRDQKKFDKANPQIAIMQQAKQIADMIRLGMLTQQAGSQELARVMMENTQATQQQSQELPRTIQAGTVEAYQAMFGKDNTAKLQLSEQKKQNDKLSEANGILKQIAAKPGMKKV